jgi:hypothetical protein
MMARRAFPKVLGQSESGLIRAVGREAETLLMLVKAAPLGVRAYDFEGGPPFRLSAYVHDLRRMGLVIRTDKEPHPGGLHAVYVLETAVSILSVLRDESTQRAA